MEDTRPRYKATCPACERVMYVCKSIGQEMGMLDFGGGNCIGCNIRLNFTFDPEAEEMISEVWDNWIEKRK